MKFFALITFVFSIHAMALTEDEVKKSVLENFQLIQEAELKLEAQNASVTAASGEFDHKLKFKSRNRIEDKYDNDYIETSLSRNTGIKGIELLAGHRQGSGQFAAYDGKYDTSAAGEIFAGISIPLLRNFSTDASRTNLEIAKIEKEQANQSVKIKKIQSVHKAVTLFYELVLEEKILFIKEGLLKLALDRTKMLEKKYTLGDIEKVKLTDNQRSIAKRQDEILKSEMKIQSLRAKLSVYLPTLTVPDLITEKNFDPTARIDLAKPALNRSLDLEKLPQVAILKAERQKLKLEKDLYEQQKLPGLGLQVLGAKELSGRQPYDPERLQVGVQFDFPLENRKAEGKTVAQEYKVQALDKNLQYVNNELTRTYDYIVRAIELGHKRLENVSNEVLNTTKMASVEKTRWIQGSSDLFVVNLREEDVGDAEVRKWTTFYGIKQNMIDYQLLNATILE